MRELYLEIIDFLHTQYGHTTPWLCRRTLFCLDAGQYFMKRDEQGKLTTYCGWFLIHPECLSSMVEKKFTPRNVEEITTGSMVWMMDAASTDGSGIKEIRRRLRARYPVSSGKKGIAWLRHGNDLVDSPRQLGVNE